MGVAAGSGQITEAGNGTHLSGSPHIVENVTDGQIALGEVLGVAITTCKTAEHRALFCQMLNSFYFWYWFTPAASSGSGSP